MGANSEISWTDHTFNPWWGCAKVSAGCAHCYADTLAHRYGHNVWGPPATTGRKTMSAAYWKSPLRWNRAAEQAGKRARVFCASMGDVFEQHPAVAGERARLWPLIDATPWLFWLLLTKRPENIAGMVPATWIARPRANVGFGTSVEDQAAADARIPFLLSIPAAMRFLSCEPLLGPLDLRDFLTDGAGHWVIAGGESGPRHRPCDPVWVRGIRDQCADAFVPFYFKQWGGARSTSGGRELDGQLWGELPEALQ